MITTSSYCPTVSVVVPLFNTERYIGATLASVLAQTFTDFEVIVVDDGSTDRGPTIVAQLTDARVRIFSQYNRGLAGARNAGIREARGRFIAFLDADDLWHQEKLAEHMAVLDARPEVGLTFSHSRLIDDDGVDLGLTQTPSTQPFTPEVVFCRNPVGNGSAPVLRRAALDSIAYYDEGRGRIAWFDENFRQSEDIECWTRIVATTAWELEVIPRALTDYRVAQGGLSANTDKQLESWQRFRAKVKCYAPHLDATAGNRAEAYQLRYLARRAVMAGDGKKALQLMARALGLSPQIVREEPARTLATLGAAAVIRALPRPISQALMSQGMTTAGQMNRRVLARG
ncbi:MAG: glycosyltransferase [Hyphomicrobiaceae bacterium]|nr:glycosyltransferase [Hyphomicrobiaceae bacterium]